jgi:hypothetical protein
MNTNQQTLNLTNMVNRKARVSFKGTSNKWLYFVTELKQEIDNNNVSSLTLYTRKYNVSNQWGAFLKSNNIVYVNNNGDYQWNEKIPVSKKLIDAFRVYQAERNMKYYPERYPEIHKSKPKVNVKKVIKVQPKLISEKFKNTDTKEIGLIRKFLKWIY